ncbi:TetR/AcrR family transcriptional regulator [Marininema halotolerans]|uniref:DNA-binding transcriptional regulator, AcrR family n=1 Tax=Marininema halotolerans TaxID=1155944 RepID=A0A1I6P3M0_9BACL|nr:TetR/AcrR family transcriptional regulator [Marininema halotolerans]SFS34759.1 DNA-binding transcriptional regulator, AcrR family [Marininema halotolerans]
MPKEMEGNKQREKYIQKLIPTLRKHGIASLKMDEITRIMDISKATLYKYFSSKADIVSEVVDTYVKYIQHIDELIMNDQTPHGTRFQKVFEQSLLIAFYVTENFLADLKDIHPVGFEKISHAQAERRHNLEKFYANGVAEDIFHPIHAQMFMLQDEIVLRKIVDPIYLLQQGLTLEEALREYYQLKKFQLFKDDQLEAVDDDAMESYIRYMANKVTLGL